VKVGELYRELNSIEPGRTCDIKLTEYLGNDSWKVKYKTTYKGLTTSYSGYSIITGENIYKGFVKISEA